MVFSVHLQRSAVVAIVNCSVRGQFNGFRSLKQVALQSIWLFQESLLGYTVQFGFDFIASDQDICCLECNPRVASGIHLLEDVIDVCSALSGPSACHVSGHGFRIEPADSVIFADAIVNSSVESIFGLMFFLERCAASPEQSAVIRTYGYYSFVACMPGASGRNLCLRVVSRRSRL